MGMINIRDSIKLAIKYIMRISLKVFYIFPIKKNRIFFMSTMGKQYSCNPKYIYEYMIENTKLNYKNIEYVWCFKDKKKFSNIIKRNTIVVSKKNIFKYIYYLMTSNVIIYNCGGFSYIPIRKKQLLIETWHGGGAFKKIGFSVKNKSYASKIGIKIASNDIKLFLSSSKVSTELVIGEGMRYKGEVLKSGLPRNDLLFSQSDSVKEKIRKKIGVSDNSKIVLYAPTFKGNENNAISINETYEVISSEVIKKSLEKRFGGKWIFAIRGHQYNNKININGADLDLSEYQDMQELLLISDILITDYSSSIWDFAITKKPCYLFVPDLIDYIDNERDFFVDINLWPGILASNNSELEKKILEYDSKKYIKKVNEFIEYMGSYEVGKSCNIITNTILQYINDKSENKDEY